MTEKMRKNSLIVLVIILILLFVALAVVVVKQEDSFQFLTGGNEITQEGGNKAQAGMEPINTMLDMNQMLETIRKNVDKNLEAVIDEEANELVALGEYTGLEKRVAIKEGKKEYTEIWLIKISKEEQSVELFRKLAQRIEDLKVQFKENEEISKILEDSNNIAMKQQGGIVILVISNKTPEIEKIIDNGM